MNILYIPNVELSSRESKSAKSRELMDLNYLNITYTASENGLGVSFFNANVF